MVVKPNIAGARCRHRKVVQNRPPPPPPPPPNSVQADTHDYFLPRGSHRKSGADMIISCGDQRLRPSVSHSRGLGTVGWLHQNSYPGRLVFSLLRRWGGVPKSCPRGSMGWCWGDAPKSCPRMGWCSKSWGWCSKKLSQNGMVFQKLGWCSKKLSQNPPRLDGVVFQKLRWCSKKLSQNPHSVYY